MEKMLDCQIFGNGGAMKKEKEERRYPPPPKLILWGKSEITTNGVKNLIKTNMLNFATSYKTQ
tara:strand:- start:534 stop:722 length:189 start_codon:yes stop_codon:yes gene_type:complete